MKRQLLYALSGSLMGLAVMAVSRSLNTC